MTEKVLEKGKYRYPQRGGTVVVRDYLICEGEGNGRDLLLRFFNERAERVTRVTVRLAFFDKNGAALSSRTQTFDVQGEGGALFIPAQKIALPEACVKFRVEVLNAAYGDYVYTPAKGGARADFCPPEEGDAFDASAQRARMGGKPLSVSRRKYKFSVLILFLALLLIAGAGVATYFYMDAFKEEAQAFYLDGVEYTFLDPEKGEGSALQVTGTHGTVREVEIPAEIDGYRVISVAEEAFRGSSALRSVKTEGSLQIASYAFAECPQLSEFDFEGVTEIGSYAFMSCTSLTKVHSSTVRSVGTSAFLDCTSLTSVQFTDEAGVPLTLSSYAFGGCSSLRSVTLDRAQGDGNGWYAAFGNSYGVEELYLRSLGRDGVASVPELFSDDPSRMGLRTLTVGEMDAIPEFFCRGMKNLERVTVDTLYEGTVGTSAFDGCISLTTLDLGRTVETVGSRAFRNTAIASFDGNRLTSLGEGAFSGCAFLRTVGFTQDTPLTFLASGTFKDCAALSEIVIPAAVEELGTDVFRGCTSLKRAAFSNGSKVAALTSGLFGDCTSLSSLTLPSGLSVIYDKVFENCRELRQFRFPSAVYYIGSEAFKGCLSLEEATLPSSLNYLGDGAFEGCGALSKVVLPERIVTIGTGAFEGCASLASIALPSSLASLPASLLEGCTSLSEIVIPQNVTSIGNAFAAGCTSLTEFTVPNGVTSVGRGILTGCTQLERLTVPFLGASASGASTLGYLFGNASWNDEVPASLRTVELTRAEVLAYGAFADCASLESIVLAEGLTSVGARAFYGCRLLASLTVPASVGQMGHAMLAECTSLEEVSLPFAGQTQTQNAFLGYLFGQNSHWEVPALPASLKTVVLTNAGQVAEYAFNNCSALERIVLPEGLSLIGERAFLNCMSLTELTLPDSVQRVEFAALENCTSLTELTLPFVGEYALTNNFLAHLFGGSYHSYGSLVPPSLRKVTVTQAKTVGAYAFYGCENLQTVVLPEDTTSIGENAFYGCRALTELELPASLERIGEYAFTECRRLSAVTLPAPLEYIGDYAFQYCFRLFEVYNESALPVIRGDFGNGYVAYYALAVYTEGGEGTIAEEGGFSWLRADDMWYLHSAPQGVEELALPAQFTYAGVPVTSYAIPAYFWENDAALKSVVISAAVTQTGESAFANCGALTSVTFAAGSQLTSIGQNTFSYCSSLEKIVLPDGLQQIGYGAFMGCGRLSAVTLPASLTSIEPDAFWNCYRLYEVYNNSALPLGAGTSDYGGVAKYALAVYAPQDTDRLAYLTVGDLYFARYRGVWTLIGAREGLTRLRLGTFSYGGETIGSYRIAPNAFANYGTLTSLEFGDAVTAVGECAFTSCSSLTEAVFTGTKVNEIGESAFSYCYSLAEVVFPEGLVRIGNNAFFSCTSLLRADLPAGLESVGDSAFYGCYALYSVTLPASLASVGYFAFEECRDLLEVRNLSALPVAAGSSEYGGVARYALALCSSAEESRFVEEGGYYFLLTDGGWQLVRCGYQTYYNNNDAFTLPDSFAYGEDIIDAYSVGKEVFIYGGVYAVVVPQGVTAIERGTSGSYLPEVVYFSGSREAWQALSENGWAGRTVYYYADCVHEAGQWCRDADGNLITDVRAEWQWMKLSTCEEEGVEQYLCVRCGAVLQEQTYPPNGHSPDASGRCTVCGKQGINAADVLGTSERLANDEKFPFGVNADGLLVSSNHDDGSSSVLTILGTDGMQVFISFMVSAASGECCVFRLNGEIVNSINGDIGVMYSSSFFLNEGDKLEVSFEKDGAGSAYDDCVYLDIVFFEK